MVALDVAAVCPDAAGEDEHALASRAAASGRAAARTPERVRMTLYSRVGKRRGAAVNENEYRNGDHFQ